MKRNSHIGMIFGVVSALSCMPVAMAAPADRTAYVAPPVVQRVSDRLIVKYKANKLPRGLSVAEINAQLSQPLSVQTMGQLQAAAGVALSEQRAPIGGAHVLTLASQPTRQTLDSAIAAIRALPNIEYVEEDAIMTAQAVPNDSFYSSVLSGGVTYPGLWGLWPASAVTSPAPGGTGSYGADFETAWNTSTGTGVVVAVVDTGITPNTDIVGTGATVAAGAGSNLVSVGYDFITDCRTRASCAATTASLSAYVAPSANATDLGSWISAQDKIDNPAWAALTVQNSSWHGTHVAGTIAGIGNNAAGVIGGAYGAKILPVRVLGKGGGTTSDIAEAILWAAGKHTTISNPNPAKVINLSLGGTATSCSATFQNAINQAVAAGAVVVVAAGNSNTDAANATPANCQNVISVAAIGRDGSRASYSNYSSPASNTTNPVNVTLAAQGADQVLAATYDPGILSTLNSGTTTPVLSGGTLYSYKQGTSMATPHVSAAAALLLAKNSALTPAQVKTILSATSSLTAFPSFSAPSYALFDCATNKNCGAGILNAKLALQNSSPTVSAQASSDFGAVFINGTVNQTLTLSNTWLLSAQAGTATVTGTHASMFSIGTDNCSNAAIASNGTCQLTVRYTPTTSGVHTATLSVPITGAASPVLVSLNGTSLVQLTTSDTNAGTMTVGKSATVTVSYTNSNVASVNTGAISLSQPSIMAVSNDNCSNATLAAGANCSATVTVSPSSAGAFSGTASLSLSVGGTPAVATISGTAVAPASSGGGGCSIMTVGADPDFSILLAVLALLGYGLTRRFSGARKQD